MAEEEKPVVVFGWPNAETSVMQIGVNSYNIVVVGKCGNLTDRIAEAKKKDYIGLTIAERNRLPRLASYISDGRFHLQQASEGMGTPKSVVLRMIESYSEHGIKFPEIQYPASIRTTNPADVFNEPAELQLSELVHPNRIVDKYKKGRSMERESYEDLVDLVRTYGAKQQKHDDEIAELKRKIAILEKKIAILEQKK